MPLSIPGTDLIALSVAKQLLKEHPQQLEGVDDEKKGEFILFAKRPECLVYEKWAEHEIKRVAQKVIPVSTIAERIAA